MMVTLKNFHQSNFVSKTARIVCFRIVAYLLEYGYYFHFPTGPEDLFYVKSELETVIDRWKYIGLALGLTLDQVKRIERENRDLEDCLTEVLTLWLKRNYNTERFGEPSWEMLARAVGHRSGGNNTALAQEIAKIHGGMYIS